MTIAFQLAVFALIATSSILLISVPIVFASPYSWLGNKNVVFSGTSLWITLVFFLIRNYNPKQNEDNALAKMLD